MASQLIRLQCGVNSYEWGKVGTASAAARYGAATQGGLDIEPTVPYAELWMGTHPKLPSRDVATGQTLLELVRQSEELLSTEVSRRYEKKLPFLFKVLSIRKALSIQAHPNKTLAAQLHQKDPSNYPDDNHKPEMTIAVTPFDGLCGFRPLLEISHFLSHVEALRDLIGSAAVERFQTAIKLHAESSDPHHVQENKKALQSVFSALMTCDRAQLGAASEKLIAEAKRDPDNFAAGGGPSPNSGKELATLVVRLNEQFPEDIGLFVQFFLNYVKLDVGEGMFLKADDIHAYLSGDIIECMASSDNVVRAGFTPKYQDTDTLTSMLTYSYSPPSEQKMSPVPYPYVSLNAIAYSSSSQAILYDPPIDEFAVVRTDLRAQGAKATFESIAGPSILICTRGKGTVSVDTKSEHIDQGGIFFIGANVSCVLESAENFESFRAFCEISEPHTNGMH